MTYPIYVADPPTTSAEAGIQADPRAGLFEAGLIRHLATLVERAGTPGIALSLRVRDRELVAAAGLASARDSAPATADDRLPISCVMKILIALLVLDADESGYLSIDDDIANYLPEVARGEAKTGITLRHLLTHSAGYVEPQENCARWGYTWERFLEFFPHRKQAFEPGTVWSYSHSGHAILRKTLEMATGRDVDALLTEHILDPLGIDWEPYCPVSATGKRMMTLHVLSPRTGINEPMRPPQETGFLRYSISDYALSARDLALIGQLFAGGMSRRLPHLEPARRKMLTPAIGVPGYCVGPYGERMPRSFCLGVADYGGWKGVNGSYVGSTCAIRFDELSGLSVAATVNIWAPYVRDLAVHSATRFLPPRPLAEPLPSPAFDDLSVLAGRYEGLMLGASNIVIRYEGDFLHCEVAQRGLPNLQGKLKLMPDGSFAFAEGSRNMCVAIARCPDTGAPYVMFGTSACRKLAA